MGEDSFDRNGRDLKWIAAATAVVLGLVGFAAVLYLLLDIVFVLFLGVVIAAALQPWHVMLRGWGVPKGTAVLLIYFLIFLGLVLVALLVGPVVIDQSSSFAGELPQTYANLRANLQASSAAALRLVGNRLPPFENLTHVLTDIAPRLVEGAVGMTTGIAKLLAYFVTVLAVAFYWTLELPRFERLFLSLLAVDKRPMALNVWHEIESKLGGYMRGQGLGMLTIGMASAVGYAVIGLPHVLALAVIAGLLEVVPLIGPILAVVPAVLVAVPLGWGTVAIVMGLAVVIQQFESNVVFPRIMNHAVGVSPLVGLLAVLAFGTLYGILGIVVAIPTAAVIQVLLESMMLSGETVEKAPGLQESPWAGVRARVLALRQQARLRLRARVSRMGIDPETADHVTDDADQRIEEAVTRAEKILDVAESAPDSLCAEEQTEVLDRLADAMEMIERAVVVGETPLGIAPRSTSDSEPTNAIETAALEDARAEDLSMAVERFKSEVEDVETMVIDAQAVKTDGPRSVVPARVRETR